MEQEETTPAGSQVKSPREQASSQQALVPLFVLATVLMGVGFYFALSNDPASTIEPFEWVEPDALVVVPDGLDAGAAPIRLAYPAEERADWTYTLHQSVGARSHESLIRLGVSSSREAGRLRWTLGEVKARVRADGEDVGAQVSSQMERLLEGAVASASTSERGELEGMTWEKGSNSQTEAMLELVGGAFEVLSPRFVAGEVAAGSSWSYELGLAGAPEEATSTLKGAMAVDGTYLGRVSEGGRELAVIVQRYSVDASGTSEINGNPERYEVDGGGDGLAFVDAKTGELVRAAAQLETSMRVSVGKEPQVVKRRLKMELARAAK